MLFWIVAAGLAAAVAALVARPLLAPPDPGGAAAPDLALYRDQLEEVGREVERGLLPPDEAGRARAEIARRLLAADRAGPRPERPAPRPAVLAAAGGAALVLVAGSLGLYAALGAPGRADAPLAQRLAAAEAARAARPSQAEAEALVAGSGGPEAPPDAPEDYLALVEAVRAAVAERPDDLQGWELLALHEARLGRHAAAARAQEQVIALKGEAATAADHLALVERLVAAAGGLVTPEAEAALAAVARRDPTNAGGRFYAGLLELQTGRPDRAFPLWRALVEEAPEGDPFRARALAGIADVAWLAGADWAPEAAGGAAPAPAGPTTDDLAAAEGMDPAARDAMVRDMVAGLADRLAAEGGPPEDWARLVTSLAVLGDAEGAARALAEARAAQGGDTVAEAVLARAATAAGLE